MKEKKREAKRREEKKRKKDSPRGVSCRSLVGVAIATIMIWLSDAESRGEESRTEKAEVADQLAEDRRSQQGGEFKFS